VRERVVMVRNGLGLKGSILVVSAMAVTVLASACGSDLTPAPQPEAAPVSEGATASSGEPADVTACELMTDEIAQAFLGPDAEKLGHVVEDVDSDAHLTTCNYSTPDMQRSAAATVRVGLTRLGANRYADMFEEFREARAIDVVRVGDQAYDNPGIQQLTVLVGSYDVILMADLGNGFDQASAQGLAGLVLPRLPTVS
jgi:hypothetical protein